MWSLIFSRLGGVKGNKQKQPEFLTSVAAEYNDYQSRRTVLPSIRCRTDKFSGLHSEFTSAVMECSLYLSPILFCLFSQSTDLPMASTPCVRGHWLSAEATRGHQSVGQIWAEVSPSLSADLGMTFSPSGALHMRSTGLVKNKPWMENKTKKNQHPL